MAHGPFGIAFRLNFFPIDCILLNSLHFSVIDICP